MKKDLFLLGIWDRLMAAGSSAAPGVMPGWPLQSLAQLRVSIARDLEDLFNTRLALPASTLDSYKACRQTILNFGLMDFAALCPGSSDDQHIICAYVTETIHRFEPRLGDVVTSIAPAIDSTNRFLRRRSCASMTVQPIARLARVWSACRVAPFCMPLRRMVCRSPLGRSGQQDRRAAHVQ